MLVLRLGPIACRAYAAVAFGGLNKSSAAHYEPMGMHDDKGSAQLELSQLGEARPLEPAPAC